MKKFHLPLAYLLLSFLGLYHFFSILKYSVDIPFMDDWEAVGPEKIPESLSLEWLVSQHNEHRFALTRLQTWLLYHTTDWNLRIHFAMNFVIFLSLIASVAFVIRRLAQPRMELFALLSLCFCLSTLPHDNHMWAIQSSFHLALLFMVLGAYFLARNTSRSLWAALPLLWLSGYSFTIGVVTTGVLITFFALYQLYLFRVKTLARGQLARVISILSVFLIVLFYSYFHNLQPNPGHPKPTGIFSGSFFDFFFNLWSLGFGFGEERLSWKFGIFCFAVSVVPLIVLLKRLPRSIDSANFRLVFGLAVSLSAAVACIAYGRSGFPIVTSKASRYGEIVMFIPVFFTLLWVGLENLSVRLRQIGAVAILLLCAVGYKKQWRYKSVYRREQTARLEGYQCVKGFALGKAPPVLCPTVYPFPLDGHLQNAKQMKVSFYEKMLKE